MNENFNGLNEANSLDNNEMNNQSSLEPTLNSINNTETLNAESESFAQSNNVYENTLSATNSENIVVSEMGAPEVINPISLNESASVDTNDTTLETQASMNTPEPNPFGVVNNEVNNFTMNVGTTNNESNMLLNESEVVSPTQNVETLETNVNTAPVTEPVKKKNNLIMILIIVLVLALGAIGGFFAYKYIVMSNPVTIIEKSLTTLGKKAETAIKEYNSEMNKLLNSKIQNELSLSLNEYSLDLLMKMDMKNKAIAAEVDAKIDNEDFLNVSGIANEESAYFTLLENTENNFVYYDDFSEAFEITDEVEEINPVLAKFATYLGESVKETLTKDDFEKSKEEISYKGKQVNATKYAMTFNAENINPILDSYKNKLVKDDELVSYIAELSAESNDGIKDIIVETIDDMKLDVAAEDEETEKVKILIYVKGTELIKISLDDPGVRLDLEVYDGINLLVKSKDDENAMLNINFKKDKFEFTYNDVDENKILANFENGKYKIEATMDEEDILVDGTYNITDTNLEFTFNTEIMGEKYSGKIISKETISDDIKIDIPSNALDVEDEETQLTLMYEIEKMPIYDLIKPYIEPEEDYYDDNYYYDDSEWEF